ncbi:MAG: ABC transporter ATP-binding protein [Clostridiales bacterium]|jgi:ABC-2 type transport system ATP-binding protein|nr:ABC transporter ATP-binding protein [Clostridiales bacterium]
MIRLENVTKSYQKGVNAVDRLSLLVPPGKIVGFLGPNGAGKTTTIKMITGILEPDEGQIEVGGHDIVKDALAAKRGFGYVPDNPDVFLRLKGVEYLDFIAAIYHVPEAEKKERILDLAGKLEILDALSNKIQSYSHGMRQKLVLIASLLHRPAVWILDEPLTGLDPKSSFLLKEMMRSHADAGGTIFFSTHVLDVAEKICDVVAVIQKGRLLFYGELEQLRQKARERGAKDGANGGAGTAAAAEDSSLERIFLEMTEEL